MYFKQNPLCFQELRSGEVLVTIAGTAEVISLSGSGIFMWQQLIQPMKTMELVNVVLKKYKVGETQAKKDVKDFLHRCVKAKVVVSEFTS